MFVSVFSSRDPSRAFRQGLPLRGWGDSYRECTEGLAVAGENPYSSAEP